MGKPNFIWNEIPLSKNIDHTNVDLGFDKGNNAFCLSMGNPHAVFFVDSVESINVSLVGPKFENHTIFPEKANISFAEVKSKSKIKMKVWERGAGQCAVAAAAKQLSKIDNNCEIILDGGILNVTILDDGSIVLKGPTEISFQGTFSDKINKLIKSN
jgi:diaminopimelate epimerase